MSRFIAQKIHLQKKIVDVGIFLQFCLMNGYCPFFVSTLNISCMTSSFSRFIAQKIHLQRKIADVSIFCNSAKHTVSSSHFSCHLLYITGILKYFKVDIQYCLKLNSNLLWLEFFLMAKLIGNSFAQKLGDNLYAINFEWVYLLHLMWIWQPLLNNFDFDWSAHDSTGWLKNQHRLSCRR